MSDWISVDDRLPDEIGEYIVYKSPNVDVFLYSPSSGWLWREGLFDGAVTHWMNLPSPPETK